MYDLFAPLGRPPLDTFSPTQVVRTAENMPTGVWEIEGGGTYADGDSVVMPVAGVRYGLLPGMQIDAVFAPYSRTARRSVGLKYAPLPAMWSLDLTYDILARGQNSSALEAGTTLEIALPWVTPRVAPRLSYVRIAQADLPRESWLPRLDLGFEVGALRPITLGADVDLALNEPSTISVGGRLRLFANVGLAIFGTWRAPGQTVPGQTKGTWSAGAITAWRF